MSRWDDVWGRDEFRSLCSFTAANQITPQDGNDCFGIHQNNKKGAEFSLNNQIFLNNITYRAGHIPPRWTQLNVTHIFGSLFYLDAV